MSTPARELRFRRLYDCHHPDVLAYFARRIGRDDAPDAADEVFAVAWRRIDVVPPDDEAILWLYGVAHGVLRNRNRSARRFGRLVARLGRQRHTGPEQPETVVLRNLDEQAALDALATLRLKDQELLRLAYWEDLTHSEIGSMLDCSKSAVDARVHRALQRMRQALRATGHMPDRRSGTETATREPKC
ncbi:MAG: sigma-70 family RNA polymerase sigma factor [Actinomycetota bacterium]